MGTISAGLSDADLFSVLSEVENKLGRSAIFLIGSSDDLKGIGKSGQDRQEQGRTGGPEG
jgi:hypothetical protein